jgi:hypothetical protein
MIVKNIAKNKPLLAGSPRKHKQQVESREMPEAGISKNYCATNSGSPEVELRFCPWLIMIKY